MRRRYSGGKIALMVLGGIAFVIAFTFIVMTLWNAILPDVLNVKTINFWQSLGLLVLSKILFSGFGGGPGKRRHFRERMQDKWQAMTPEQREKFKQEWKDRCGWKARFVREQPLENQQGAGTEPG